MRTTTRNLVATAIGLLLAVLMGSAAWAQTSITVTDLGDPTAASGGGCTLRDAINIATIGSAGDSDVCAETGSGTGYIIQFSVTGTITLTSTLPTIFGDVIINGPTTAPGITINGNNQYTVLESFGGNLTLNDLTIANGSGFEGGGILGTSGSTLTVTNSTFSGNTASIAGGAILTGGTVTVTNSTFYDNSAGSTGTGGGIYNAEGTLTLTNSTFYGNSAGSGGGIFVEDGTLNIDGTIITASTGHNCALSSPANDEGYNVTDEPSTDNTCGLTGSTDQIVTSASAVLDTTDGLANNGGPTETIALSSSSTNPAINLIPLASCTYRETVNPCSTSGSGDQLTCDQRGDPRPGIPTADACDAGAYEYQQTTAPFAYYQAALAIDLPETFLALGDFTPATGSPAINPTTQAVTLTLSSSGFAPESITIPAGSFKKSAGQYVFTGKVGDVDVAALITAPVKNSYGFSIGATRLELRGITNPVTVTLQVGTNTGTTSIKALIL
jgi:hypothetical protein